MRAPLNNRLDVSRASRVARRFAARERGTQLVELAVVLPLLLMLFAATAEFGRYFHTYATLAKSTRAASRYLSTVPVKAGGANATEDARAKRLAVYGDANAVDGVSKPLVPGLTTTHVEITRAGGVGSVPGTVKVAVSGYDYAPLFNLGRLTKGTAWLSVPVAPATTMRYLLTTPSI